MSFCNHADIVEVPALSYERTEDIFGGCASLRGSMGSICIARASRAKTNATNRMDERDFSSDDTEEFSCQRCRAGSPLGRADAPRAVNRSSSQAGNDLAIRSAEFAGTKRRRRLTRALKTNPASSDCNNNLQISLLLPTSATSARTGGGGLHRSSLQSSTGQGKRHLGGAPCMVRTRLVYA